jgi:hypothetical protein
MPPLNTFQRLLLQWDALHPYNAAQILKLSGRGDLGALGRAWGETMGALGVSGAEPAALTSVPRDQVLSDFISEQLNLPFKRTESLFRPFVIDQGDHHYAGIVYHHYAADSVSIRTVLREWFLRLHHPELARTVPMRSAAYNSIFGPGAANWSLLNGLFSSARWAARNRRVARVEHAGQRGFQARFTLHELGPGLVTPLLAYARRHRATLNDLFLAVVADTCAQFAPIKRSARRPDLALGTIVDLRPYARRDLSETFGLFLGFTSTVCRPRDLRDFPTLLRAVAAQSREQKRSRVPLYSPLRMMAGLAVGKLYGPKKLTEFYRKRVPLAGGISNVNLNRTWAAEYHPHPLLDYLRVSPTGPMMPLVFTPTTLGDRLHFGFTHRPSLLPDARAAEMVRAFGERLRSLA